MDINVLTIGQAKELSSMFSNKTSDNGLQDFIGQQVIIRTYSAGVWFGKLDKKSGKEVILSNARRMWRWKTAKSISLSGCAIYGIDYDYSKIAPAVENVWLEAIEIIECSKVAIESINGAPYVEAE